MTTVSMSRRQGVNVGSAIKVPCITATTANITLSGLQTIDGILLVDDDRVLVKNQSDASENGIYVADSSTWDRAVDFDGIYDVKEGTLVYVNRGTTQGETLWRVTSSGTPVPDTDDIEFEQCIVNESGSIDFTDGIAFPATQASSAGANTLDDYEEGTWTPVLTFATPGNLSVVYSIQQGGYTKIGNHVTLTGDITTSTFTHTTASGVCTISGLPFAAKTSSNQNYQGSLAWQGITKASYTQVTPRIVSAGTTITLVASGSGQSIANVEASDMPTAGTVALRFTITYLTP